MPLLLCQHQLIERFYPFSAEEGRICHRRSMPFNILRFVR